MRLAILLLALLPAFAHAATPRLAHESTGEIFVPMDYGHGQGGTCAKVAVDSDHDYILTAAHVLKSEGRLYNNARITYKSGQRTNGRVAWMSNELDAAIIRADRTSVKFFPVSAKMDGTLYAEGKTQGTRKMSIIRNHGDHVLLTSQAWHGDSGGPLRNSRGFVTGVITAYDDNKNTVATPVSVIWLRARTPLRKILSLGCAPDVYRPFTIGQMPQIQGQYCPPGQSCPPMGYIQPYNPRPAIPPQERPPYEGGGLGPGVDPGPEPPDAQPAPVPDPEPTAIDYDAIAAAVIAKLPDPVPGPEGPAGPKGDPGEPGLPGAPATLDKELVEALADELVNSLRPLTLNFLDANGQVARSEQVPASGGAINIPAQRLNIRYVDSDGQDVREAEATTAPLGDALKVRFEYIQNQ